MKPTFEWKKPLNNGRLRTPVHFLSNSYDGPEPSEDELSEVFSTFCEIYNSSMKDIEILNNVNAKFNRQCLFQREIYKLKLMIIDIKNKLLTSMTFVRPMTAIRLC